VNIRLLSPSASLDAITCQTSVRPMDSVADKSAQADLLLEKKYYFMDDKSG
jgi:hypothetical protein